MRIISQNLMDFPYKQIVVMVGDNKVICRPVSNMEGRYYLLGKYKDCERAKEVFHSINKQFSTIPLMKAGEALYNQTTFVMPEE